MRNLILILAGILLLVVLALVLRNRLNLGTGKQPELTMDLRTLMPGAWKPYASVIQCDFDGDPASDPERLVLFRYDASAANPNGLIGGVVFADEVDRVPQAPGNQSAYRPAFLIPYKLLPDIYSNKGQGYLGEADVQVRFWSTTAPGQNQPCRAQEINIFGSNGVNYTRLSVFRWDAASRSYAGWHFAGTARVSPGPVAAGQSQIVTHVVTYDRFNDRSMLCQVHVYDRPGSSALPPASLAFTETQTPATIDFCYGAPPDPAYPEGVVLAALRGNNPPEAKNDSPTGANFLLNDGNFLPSELAFLKNAKRDAVRVLVDRHHGLLGPPYPVPYPAQGTAVPNPAPDLWWWSAEQAFIDTTIDVPRVGTRDYCWTLRNIANTRVSADSHWRVENVAPGFCP